MTKKSSASSRQEKLRRVKQENIIVSKKMLEQLEALKKRKAMPDDETPEITDWSNAVVGKFYRPVKKQITVRIDADVLEWFKHAAKKYQPLINKACREYMLHHLKTTKSSRQKYLAE